MAIGEHILDLSVVAGFYPVELQDALKAPVLNPLMALGWDSWRVVRETTQKLLLVNSELDKNVDLKSRSVGFDTDATEMLIYKCINDDLFCPNQSFGSPIIGCYAFAGHYR